MLSFFHSCHCERSEAIPSPTTKYHSIRGGSSSLFASHLWIDHPTLLLVDSEFDAILCWQLVRDLCDVATLGSASNRLAFPNLAALSLYPRILAVYDSDPAGDLARAHLSHYSRVTLLHPPAHDLTDYFRLGNDLHAWLSIKLTSSLLIWRL